jgi:hypothetical protein
MSRSETGSTAGVLRSPGRTEAILVGFGHFLFKRRKFVFPLMSLAILLVGKPLLPFGSERWDLVLDAIIAVAIRSDAALVIGLAHIKRGGESGEISRPDKLVVEGLFALRNPL